jgi:FkbM family methyltransferase
MYNPTQLFVRRFFRAPGYIRNFGLWHGLRLLFSVEKNISRDSDSIRSYKVPGYCHYIYLRDTVSDHATFRQCMVMQQYDFLPFPQSARLMHYYHECIARNETPLIIDCGANIGLATLWFFVRFPKACIVAVEPDTENFKLLTKNTEHLGAQVKRLQGGIWDRSTNLVITNPDAGSSAFQVKEIDINEKTGIRAYTINEICTMNGTAAPFIVKLDIEGAQSTLFRSNTDWVKNTPLITLELDDWLLPWSGCNRNFFSCVSQYPADYLLKDESIFYFRDFLTDKVEQ